MTIAEQRSRLVPFYWYLLSSIPIICFFLSAAVLVWIFSVAKSTVTVSHQVDRLVTLTRLVWFVWCFDRMIRPVKVQNRCKTGFSNFNSNYEHRKTLIIKNYFKVMQIYWFLLKEVHSVVTWRTNCA